MPIEISETENQREKLVVVFLMEEQKIQELMGNHKNLRYT